MIVRSQCAWLAMLCTIVVSVGDGAAQEAETIELPLPWKAGDELLFQRTTKITNVTQGLVQEGIGKRTFALKILRADGTGLLVSMRYGKPFIEGEAYTNDPFTLPFNDLASRFEYELELDPAGTPIDLANWQKIQDGLNKAIDEMESQSPAPGAAGGAAIDRQSLLAMFADKEQIIERARRDFDVLTLPYSRRYTLGTTQEEVVEPDDGEVKPRVFRRSRVLEFAPGRPGVLQLTIGQVVDVEATRAYYARRQREGATENEILLFQAWEGILAQVDHRTTSLYTLEAASGRLLEATSTLTEQTGENLHISELSLRATQ